MIIFDQVSVAYTLSSPVFKNWSFTIPDNSITTILGANGSGKTTLLKCLTNQLHIYEGSITINGERVSLLNSKELAKLIAYVPQNCISSIDYRVLDFIAFGRTPHLRLLETPSEKDYRFAFDCAEECGITHISEKSMTAISGGERQLAYIARALAQETSTIIMDEPMSALDFGNQSVILKIIADLANRGKTIVFTSHNPNHALAISSNVLVIDQEKNVIWGDASHLLKQDGVLAKVFGSKILYQNSKNGGYITFNLL